MQVIQVTFGRQVIPLVVNTGGALGLASAEIQQVANDAAAAAASAAEADTARDEAIAATANKADLDGLNITDPSTFRGNIGVEPGVDVQVFNAASAMASQYVNSAGSGDVGAALLAKAQSSAVYEVVLDPGTYRIGSDVTWPVETNFRMAGGRIEVADGVTLTIRGDFTADAYAEVFTFPGAGTGKVVGIRDVSLEWFGGKGDGNLGNPAVYTGTDNAPAWNRARDCLEESYFSDDNSALPVLRLNVGVYTFLDNAFFYPARAQPFVVWGSGVNGGSGTLIGMQGGSFGPIASKGSTDDERLCYYEIKNLAVYFSYANPDGIMLVGDDPAITGSSGATVATRLDGTIKSLIEDLVVSEGELRISNTRFLRFKNVSVRRFSSSRLGNALTFQRVGMNDFCGDFEGDIEVVAQNGGDSVLYLNYEDGPDGPAYLSGIRLAASTFYNGRSAVVVRGRGSSTKPRSITDNWLNQVQLHGTAPELASGWAIDVEAAGYCEIEAFKAITCYANYMANGVRLHGALFDGVYGKIVTPLITDMQFQFIAEQVADLDSVLLGTLTGTMRDCGSTAATATEHVNVFQCRGLNINLRASQVSPDSWPGIATGIKIDGGVTRDIVTSGSLIGTTTAVDDDSGAASNVSLNTGLTII